MERGESGQATPADGSGVGSGILEEVCVGASSEDCIAAEGLADGSVVGSGIPEEVCAGAST